MDIQLWQILVLCIYGFIAIWDEFNLCLGLNKPVIAGLFAGLILGDITAGLYIGGTLQLMVLGVGSFGGSSMPDYMSGALIGTAFVAGMDDPQVALAVAVPAGLLLVNFDLLARFANAYFQRMADNAADATNYRKVEIANMSGALFWGLSRALPIFIALYFGRDVVSNILDASPEWIMSGLRVAGGLLPALGIAILLRYLPFKKFWVYVLAGFVASAYLNVPMLGVAFIGLIAAAIVYNNSSEKVAYPAANSIPEGDTIEDDE